MNSIDSISIDKIVQEYGSPVFVVSSESLRNNLKTFREKFSTKYPKVEVAYSYKTNSLPGVLDIIHREGAWAEVASGFEYDLARALGVPGESIVFNGPYKRREELRKASEEGALVNIDHLNELNIIEEIAIELGRVIEIGIRINADVGIHQSPDRFGFNLESGEAMQVVRRCIEKKLVSVIGLHIHLTSYIIEPNHEENMIPARRIELVWPKSSNMYGIAAKKVVSFSEEIRRRFGVNIKCVDMGGGFPKNGFLDAYVESIAQPLIKGFGSELPILILEPGRAIVRDTIQLITTIVGVKEFPRGERGIIVDAGINLLPTSLWRWQEIEPLTKSECDLRQTTVYGPLCLQTDILAETKLPQELKTGDKLIIKNVGAYNISQSSSFIFPRPPVLLVEDGLVKVIRRAERVEDIFNLKHFNKID
ncbi:MAG TPA: alanine racemase [Thermodesulfobacteriota bacterium]